MWGRLFCWLLLALQINDNILKPTYSFKIWRNLAEILFNESLKTNFEQRGFVIQSTLISIEAMEAMCKFIWKSNDWIFWKLNKFKILGLFSMIHVTMAMTQIFSLGSNKKLAWDWALGKGKRQKLGWNDKKTNKQTNKKQLVSKASEVVDWGSWTPNCLALLANFFRPFPHWGAWSEAN